jgi:hypothetical protein
VQIFVLFLISWFDTIHKIHENWYVTNNNEFTVVKNVQSEGYDLNSACPKMVIQTFM